MPTLSRDGGRLIGLCDNSETARQEPDGKHPVPNYLPRPPLDGRSPRSSPLWIGIRLIGGKDTARPGTSESPPGGMAAIPKPLDGDPRARALYLVYATRLSAATQGRKGHVATSRG